MNKWFDVEYQTKSFGQRSGSEKIFIVVTSLMVLEDDVSKKNYWMMIWRRQEATLLWNGSYWFQRQNMTWYNNVQGWLSWECNFMSIHWMNYLKHIDDTEMSWKHWPKTELKVWWTIGMNELSWRLPNPNSHDDGVKCQVQEQPATIKVMFTFPNFTRSFFD